LQIFTDPPLLSISKKESVRHPWKEWRTPLSVAVCLEHQRGVVALSSSSVDLVPRSVTSRQPYPLV